MKITRKELRRLIAEALGPKYGKDGKLVSQVVTPHLTMRSLPHSYQATNTRRSPEEYLDPEDKDAYFDKIRALRYQEDGAAQADNLALGLGAEPPETGFFDMTKDFADEMATRARVEDRDEYGDMGYDSIINFSADDNIDFRRLHGDAFDYDMSSNLFRLSDDLHGVDIKRVIMKLKQYIQTDEYNTLDLDLRDQVKNTIASLQSEYDEKMSGIFGDQ
jgi:hypothetical protein